MFSLTVHSVCFCLEGKGRREGGEGATLTSPLDLLPSHIAKETWFLVFVQRVRIESLSGRHTMPKGKKKAHQGGMGAAWNGEAK